MIVVADSGPLHYLILLDHVGLLQRFHARVAVPDAVAAGFASRSAPAVVRAWIEHPPWWVEVLSVALEALAAVTDVLDPGERSAIARAESLQADLLLIDEAAGRAEAKRRHLRVCARLFGELVSPVSLGAEHLRHSAASPGCVLVVHLRATRVCQSPAATARQRQGSGR